jgi:hypothetical protein
MEFQPVVENNNKKGTAFGTAVLPGQYRHQVAIESASVTKNRAQNTNRKGKKTALSLPKLWWERKELV